MDVPEEAMEEVPEVAVAAPKCVEAAIFCLTVLTFRRLAVAEDDLIDSDTAWETLGLDLRLLKVLLFEARVLK